jgi:hypothetical protein
MNRFAQIIFSPQNINLYKNKKILNKNIILQGYNCIINTNFTNTNNLFIHNCDKNFLINNITCLLGAKNIYFNNIYNDCSIFHEIQRKVNYDNRACIYINEHYYDKYMNYIETYSKYISGSSYDNSQQIRPLFLNKYNNLIENVSIENTKFN